MAQVVLQILVVVVVGHTTMQILALAVQAS
jgi:hypothetical protein